MKKGNLYKVMVIMLVLVFNSVMSFAQSDKKELKKNNTMIINVEVDDNGNTTIDTIWNGDHDLKNIMVEVQDILTDAGENAKQVSVQVIKDLQEGNHEYMMEFSEKQKEMEEAFNDLQKELESLEITKEARVRIDQAMKTLESVDWNAHVVSLENAIVNAHQIDCGSGEKETVNVFIEDGDTTEVHTKMIFMSDNGKAPSNQNMNVWVTDNGDNKIIIKTNKDGKSEEKMIFISDDKESALGEEKIIMMNTGDNSTGNTQMIMLRSANEKEISNAQEAGINIITKDRLSINNMNVEIENKDVQISLKTDEKGKMKVTVLDGDFHKLKQLKAVKDEGAYKFPLDLEEINNENTTAKYLLIEQNKKMELMRL